MICYWSERCMLRPSLWFVTGQNAVCYDQVDDLLLVRTLYVTTKLMICNWSEHCMLRPSLWFVTGQNTVCYDQVYDLLLVRTLYVTTKFMICYWSVHYVTTKFMICYLSEHYVTTKFMICYWWECCMIWPSLRFVTGQNTVCYDQVYDLLLGRTLYATTKFMICYRSKHYATTKFMICYWSERCMLRPILWFVTFQNAICYDK
jgi:hypothetical protein